MKSKDEDKCNNKESIEDKLIKNNYKLVADKIRKTLLNIRNIPGISEKRWIWELIQNAKDVPNKFNKVEIKIHLKKDSLIFSHNGEPFKIDDVLGILQQVSSKDSLNSGDQTGKFGTGFIGTHLLSDIVKIKGIVKYNGVYRRFEIRLDRSARGSEELSKEVSRSINEFKTNMTVEANSKYKKESFYNQKQTDFDTIFEYKLQDENARRIAKEGLIDLEYTAPVTMATQFKNILSITIKDDINGEENKYTIENRKKTNNINLNIVTKTSKKDKNKKLYFYSYENEICRLLYQVEKRETGFYVVERKDKQPILYRDFPLIGSENFHFPFFLDGFKFNPLETRNGLYLNGDLNVEASENRKILENAIESSITFCEWLLKQNIDKRYLLAQSKIPEPPQRYDKSAKDWFIEQQKDWRRKLAELSLLRDEDNYNQLKKLKLPQFKGKYNKQFYELIKKMSDITGGIIPLEEDIEKWYDIMEKDPLKEVYGIKDNTWNFNYLFTEEDLFRKIEGYQSISHFTNDLNKDNGEIIEWLNELYNFLNVNNCKDCFNKFAIIPNQNLQFKKINEIFGNDKEKIDEIINPIYKEIFNKEINDIILHENINLISFRESLRKKNFQNILNEFSNFIKEENDENKKKYLCNQLISFKIFRIENNRRIENEIIKQMFYFRRESQPQYRNTSRQELSNCYGKHNIWKEVEDYWFNNHPKIIESAENIEVLSTILPDLNASIWLNRYITFLKNNSTITEKKKIFPNQKGYFKYLRELHYDDNIPDILKDIFNSLQSENNCDIRNVLLLKEIECYKGHDKITQKEIISIIEELFNNYNKTDEQRNKMNLNKIAEKIMAVLPVGTNKKYQTINKALRELITYYNIIKDKNIRNVETEITTELNYEIFIKFILEKLFKFIEGMNEINDYKIIVEYEKNKENKENNRNLQISVEEFNSLYEKYRNIPNKDKIKKKIETIPHLIKFAWKYQSDDDVNLKINLKSYNIFVNQNYKFKKLEEIYLKEKFGNLKYTDIENQIFQLSKSKIINVDYKENFLASFYDTILFEYRTKFKTKKLIDICKNAIDYKIYDFFYCNKNQNLIDRKYEDFRKAFFALNKILKLEPSLKTNFPQIMRERGNISLKLLECDEGEMDNFIEDIERIVTFKAAN